MIGMIQAQIETINGAGLVLMNGELKFEQEFPIQINNERRVLFNYDPITTAYSSLSPNEIIELYQLRSGNN